MTVPQSEVNYGDWLAQWLDTMKEVDDLEPMFYTRPTLQSQATIVAFMVEALGIPPSLPTDQKAVRIARALSMIQAGVMFHQWLLDQELVVR